MYISDVNLQLYDKENNRVETYPATGTKFGGKIGKGRKTTASKAYALNDTNNYIEIEYHDIAFSTKKAYCKVILEW